MVLIRVSTLGNTENTDTTLVSFWPLQSCFGQGQPQPFDIPAIVLNNEREEVVVAIGHGSSIMYTLCLQACMKRTAQEHASLNRPEAEEGSHA